MLSDANVCDPAFADGTLFGFLDFSFSCESRWPVLMDTLSQCAPLFLVCFLGIIHYVVLCAAKPIILLA